MALPPSIQKQFLVSLIVSLPIIMLLVWCATLLDNRLEPATSNGRILSEAELHQQYHPKPLDNTQSSPPENSGEDIQLVGGGGEVVDEAPASNSDDSESEEDEVYIPPVHSQSSNAEDESEGGVLSQDEPPIHGVKADSTSEPILSTDEKGLLQEEETIAPSSAERSEDVSTSSEDNPSEEEQYETFPTDEPSTPQMEEETTSEPISEPAVSTDKEALSQEKVETASAAEGPLSIPTSNEGSPSEDEQCETSSTNEVSAQGILEEFTVEEEQEKSSSEVDPADMPMEDVPSPHEQPEQASDEEEQADQLNEKDHATKEGHSTSFFMEDLKTIDCSHLSQHMVKALQRGSFSTARQMALLNQNENPACESTLASLYKEHANAFLAAEYSLVTVRRVAAMDKIRSKAIVDSPECWNPLADGLEWEDASSIVLERWDLCCSQLESAKEQRDFNAVQQQCFHDGNRLCCGFVEGSLSHLRLPALQEVAVNMRLDIFEEELALEQDGFLRKYDPAGVLWPTGYLLSMCLADPELCGVPELLEAAYASTSGLIAIELGAGIGAPSLVLAKLLQVQDIADNHEPRVLATDQALHALALTAANSQAVGAPVLTQHLKDHANLTELSQLGQRFAIVLGSSLQSLFDWKTRDPGHTLWKVLDVLLDPKNSNAIAILAHVMGAVEPPRDEGALFELVRTISGNDMDMRTRSGDDSDFAISVYRRKLNRQEDEGRTEDEL